MLKELIEFTLVPYYRKDNATLIVPFSLGDHVSYKDIYSSDQIAEITGVCNLFTLNRSIENDLESKTLNGWYELTLIFCVRISNAGTNLVTRVRLLLK